MKRFLGVTVLPEFAQNEGAEAVLDRLAEVGVQAITVSPRVYEPTDDQTAIREPPIDAGEGKVRVHDRPLWGKYELFVRQSPSYAPDRDLYRGLKYQPPEADELTRREGPIVAELIAGAHARGMKCYFQFCPGIPPGLHEDDHPRMPDGRFPARRLAYTASLASQDVLAYTDALVRDLLEAYPEIDGFRPDWPEYPPYFLEDALCDFSGHAAQMARELGFDFEHMQHDALALQKSLSQLTNAALEALLRADGARFWLLRRLIGAPGILDWLRFKAALSTNLLRRMRQTITDAAGPTKELAANAFSPPFSLLSGLDFNAAARCCDAVCPKLYTMHWSLIVKLYAEHLLAASAQLDEGLVVRNLARLFDLVDQDGDYRLSDYGYPTPDRPHPVGREPQLRKIAQVVEAVAGRCNVYPIVHSYGPADDFRRRLQLVGDSAADGLWINRYGYLSDEKLAMVGSVD